MNYEAINRSRQLWLRQYRDGDDRALTKLVLSFDKMIYKHAHKVCKMYSHLKDNHLEDLHQVGCEAVVKAAVSFRNYEAANNNFTSYTSLIIKSDHWKYVKRSYLVDAKLDGISQRCNKKLFFKISSLLDIVTTYDPEIQEQKRREFSNRMDIPLEDIIEAEARVRMMQAVKEVDEDTLPGAVEDNNIASMDYQLLKREVDKAIECLTPDQKTVLQHRFFTVDPLPIRKLGPLLGCHYLTVNARTKAALKKLKGILEHSPVVQELMVC